MDFTIVVEDDKTCSVLMGDFPKITGLSPESATEVKTALQTAFECGVGQTFRKVEGIIREANQARAKGLL